jgi:hypothetical protein
MKQAPSHRYRLLLRMMAALFVSAALYHAAALAIPAFARAANPTAYSPLRHIVFTS